VKEINSIAIEDFISKIYAAQKTNQRQITLDIKEAQIIAQNLSLILARAVGNMDKALETVPDQQVTVSMDGGSL
jgi:hypothetical protein